MVDCYQNLLAFGCFLNNRGYTVLVIDSSYMLYHPSHIKFKKTIEERGTKSVVGDLHLCAQEQLLVDCPKTAFDFQFHNIYQHYYFLHEFVGVGFHKGSHHLIF